METITYKKYFIKLGILSGFLAILFGILVYPALASKKQWQKNLKLCVEKVLDEYDSNNWTVGNSKVISNSFSSNAACYEATNRKTGETVSAVIIRITSFYGPVAAVFTVDDDNNVVLVGFSSLHGRIARNLDNNKSSKRFEYWKYRLPEILK